MSRPEKALPSSNSSNSSRPREVGRQGADSVNNQPSDAVLARSERRLPQRDSVANPGNPSLFPQLDLEKQPTSGTVRPHTPLTSASSITNDLLGTLHTFYKQGQFTDVKIHIAGKTIRAHRVVLAAASDYFRAMFSLNMAERSNGVVNLHDLVPSAVQTLVDFAYVPELKPPLTTENVQPLLWASSILQFSKVLTLCCEFIADNLDHKHALSILPIAQHFGLSELMHSVREYIARNFHEIVLRGVENLESSDLPEDVLRLSEADLLAIFTDKQLSVRSESILLEVLLKWAQCVVDGEEENSRTDSARRIFMEAIKPAYLPVETIYRLMRTESIFGGNSENEPQIRDLLQDALICQLDSNDGRKVSSLLGSTRTNELKTPRRCYSGALVCVGGRQASSEPFRSAEVYDWTADRWLKIPDLNARRRHVGVAVCSYQDKRGLYAVGGHDGTRHLDSVEVLPLEPGGRWRTVASLRTLRRGLAVTTVQVDDSTNWLFAIGGLDDQSCFPHVEIYDPYQDAWNFGPAMSQSRGGVACAAIGTRIYAVGGNDGTFSVDTGEVLDPGAGRWIPTARMRNRRAGAGLSVMNGCLWVVGGFDENVPLNAVEFYDPRANCWCKGPNMRTPRGGVGLATMGNYLFAVGGHDGTDYLASVECFDPRMFVTSYGNTPVSSYSSNQQGGGSLDWEYVAQLGSGRAGAGLVHIPDIMPTTDLPICSTSVSTNRPVADTV